MLLTNLILQAILSLLLLMHRELIVKNLPIGSLSGLQKRLSRDVKDGIRQKKCGLLYCQISKDKELKPLNYMAPILRLTYLDLFQLKLLGINCQVHMPDFSFQTIAIKVAADFTFIFMDVLKQKMTEKLKDPGSKIGQQQTTLLFFGHSFFTLTISRIL